MREVYHWQDDAECREYPAELFVLDKGDSSKAAKKVCALCIVRDECLAHGLAIGDDHAILGGTTPRERRKMRRKAQ